MHKSEGLIKNSASFKSPQIFHTSLAHLAHDHEGLQIARTLFIYLIIYFRLVVYIVTCTVLTTSASYCGLGPAPAPFRPPHVPRSTCAQWWKIRTTSASYRGSKTTLPPLACTMQQAHVSLHKGMPLNWGYGQKFNGMPLCKLQVLAASCTPMVAV